ncbi:MAG TPA: hypothetical protein VFF66_06195 [Brevundimonas sp.]|nr:hypothetical protein [Brevundimonas sp.]
MESGNSHLGVGIALGVAIGAALGVAMDNIAIGMGLGIAIGIGGGLAMDESRKRRKNGSRDDSAATDDRDSGGD